MNSKLLAILALVALAAVGTHATTATDKAVRAAADAAKKAAGDAADYASDTVDRARKVVHDHMHDDPETLADRVKHAVRDAAGNIIGGSVKSTAKAGVVAGGAKMAYEAAHKIKERVWDSDDEDSDPEVKSRNDRLRRSCKERSGSRAAAEECFKDAKEWNDIEGEVDAFGDSTLSRIKNSVGGAYASAKEYVTGDKKEEKKGWL